MNFQTSHVISTALISSLLFVGCGKKKELNSGEPAPAPAGPAAPVDPTPAAPAPAAPANPANPAGPQLRQPPARQEERDRNPRNGEQQPQQPRRPDLRPAPEVGGGEPREELGQTPREEGQNPAQFADFERGENRYHTGLKGDQDLYYSGSGSDGLLEYFKKLNLDQPAVQKNKDLRRAADIASSKLEIDSFSGSAMVTLTMNNGSKYVLAGNPDGEQHTELRRVRSLTTGRLLVTGFHKCVDLDGRCTVSYAKVKFSDGSAVRVIYRNTVADYHVVLPKKDSGSPEYVLWEAFLVNGAFKNSTKKRLQQVEISSWEVVNGRSAAQTRMYGADDNLIAFSGPLLMPEAGTGVSLAMSRLTEKSGMTDDLMTRKSEYEFEYATMLAEIRMVNNNGRGQMRYLFKTRKRSVNPQDVITITFARVENPVMNASEIAAFEKRKK